MVNYSGKSSKTGHPEGCCSEELRKRGDEAYLTDVVSPHIVPGCKPPPAMPIPAKQNFIRIGRVGGPDTIPLVSGMVVTAGAAIRLDMHQVLLLRNLLQRPSKAAGAILVDGLPHQEHGRHLEDRCAEESRYAAPVEDLGAEFRGWSYEREPDEEGLDDPDYGTDGVKEADPV